jgi:flavoprotein hydroxylase
MVIENASVGPAGEAGGPQESEQADILIVGYGPVGQVLAILLAQFGWRVVVVERWLVPYAMPRAVAFDSEGARILAAAGIGEAIGRIGEPSGDYIWENASGQSLMSIDVAERGRCHWPESSSMYQPALEEALIARGAALPNLTVYRGHQAVDVAVRDEGVDLVTVDADGRRRTFSALWAVGCDGANSMLRTSSGIESTDLGFSHDWLICDVVMTGAREFKPNNLQICDPARPRTAVSAGPGHRRWEFMRVGEETVEGLNTAESAWRLLELFDVRPDNAKLERYNVYTFAAGFANEWRSGRVLLAGDAAHVMPPFAAQGMTSGFRDAANVAWRLDAVLRGTAAQTLLDTYAVERRAHVQHAIMASINLGKIICQTDPAAAADRDLVMREFAKRPVPESAVRQRSPLQPLTDGLLHRGPSGKPARPAGNLVPQGEVARGGETALFDELVPPGFVLLSGEDPRNLLDDDAAALLQTLGTRLVHVVPAGAGPKSVGEGAVVGSVVGAVVDVDDVYLPYLAETRALAVLVRPDFYVFGAARDREGLAALVADLRGQLDGSGAGSD